MDFCLFRGRGCEYSYPFCPGIFFPACKIWESEAAGVGQNNDKSTPDLLLGLKF